MRWAGNIAYRERMKNENKILVGKHEGRDHLQSINEDWRITMERILEKLGEKV
jgi:hypothetical protein